MVRCMLFRWLFMPSRYGNMAYTWLWGFFYGCGLEAEQVSFRGKQYVYWSLKMIFAWMQACGSFGEGLILCQDCIEISPRLSGRLFELFLWSIHPNLVGEICTWWVDDATYRFFVGRYTKLLGLNYGLSSLKELIQIMDARKVRSLSLKKHVLCEGHT